MTIDDCQQIRRRCYGRLNKKGSIALEPMKTKTNIRNIDMTNLPNVHPIINEALKIVMPPKTFVINLTETEKLIDTLENSYTQSEFFHALQQIQIITKNASIIIEDFEAAVDGAKDRICVYCLGSGEDGASNDPYAKRCPNCKGGGLS